MSAYYDTKKAAFVAMLALWAVPVSYNNIQVTGISTPAESMRELTRTVLEPKKTSTISLLRDDFAKLGFTHPDSVLRANLISDHTTYEVYSVISDPAEPTIDLRCYIKI